MDATKTVSPAIAKRKKNHNKTYLSCKIYYMITRNFFCLPRFLSVSKIINALASITCLTLCACVGGPTKDFYNPVIYDAKFSGPPSIEMVEDATLAERKAVVDGYKIIGRTIYAGKLPEAKELKAQANRVHSNYVIYQVKYSPPQPGAWHFSMGGWGGEGGSGGGTYAVRIDFLGK